MVKVLYIAIFILSCAGCASAMDDILNSSIYFISAFSASLIITDDGNFLDFSALENATIDLHCKIDDPTCHQQVTRVILSNNTILPVNTTKGIRIIQH